MPGLSNGTAAHQKSASGTAKLVSGDLARTRLVVQSDAGTELTAEGVSWGVTNVDVGTSYGFAAPDFGYDASDISDVRYPFTGYVVSNKTSEVARGETRSVDVTPEAGMGPYVLTWLTSPRQTRTAVSFTGDGAGTVTESGIAHTDAFEVWTDDTNTVTLTAAAATGSTFAQFTCADLADGYSENPTLAISAESPHAVSVYFAAGRVKRAFLGSSANDLTDPRKWSPTGVPSASQEAYFTNKTITATSFPKYAKLVISGGTFKIGGTGDPRTGFSFEVADAFEVSDGAKVYFYAKEFSDLAVFTNQTTAAAEIWKERSVVKVGGKFTVSGGAVVYPVADPVTGTPVVFDVGSFALAADGTVNANGAGWRWRPTGTRTFANGVVKSTGAAQIDGAQYASVFTLAFGPGVGYNPGASHGGLGAMMYNQSIKPVYGYRAAPFLPGSPGGSYAASVQVSDGGGVICILASGVASLSGTLTANARQNSGYGGASGGSVWIAAGEIYRSDTLCVTAKGSAGSSGAYMPGGGGRIAFVQGVSAETENFTRLVAGEEPESLDYAALSFTGLSVAGGSNGSASANNGGVGTALQIYDPSAFETVSVRGSPVNAVSTGVSYGDAQVLPGNRTYSVTDWGYDPSDTANVRYRCGGWVASNATTRVAGGTDGNAVFEVVKGKGPYTLSWLWTDRETRTVVTPPSTLGAIRCGDEVLASATEYWVRDDATLTLEAVPNDGCALTTWHGAPRGSETANPLVLAGDEPHTAVTAYFHDAASSATRYWKKGVDGSFYVAANWVDGVVPSYGDTVVVSNGTCRVSDYLRLAGLVVTNAGAMVVSGVDAVSVAGDLTLGGTATLTVRARATDAAHTFAAGATRVSVGGTLRLVESAVLYPKSDPLTGGSVRFDVRDFFLASGASVNADLLGWAWVEYTGTPFDGAYLYTSDGVKYQTFALGCGWGYDVSGNYGYAGNFHSGASYGRANAPIHPGSPNGIHVNVTQVGGGLVRIHASGRAEVHGTITANGNVNTSVYSASSGGGIWLTARDFTFGETAVLSARGGAAGYNSNGGGGRIAIGCVVDDARLASLAESGTYERLRPCRIHDEAWFRANVGNASMTVSFNSCPGSGQIDKLGTFVFIDGFRRGSVLIVR